jgi:hypothetical protein
MPRKVYVNGEEDKKERRLVDMTEHAHVGDINKMMEAARQRVRRGKSAKVPDGDQGKLKRPE